ncbi:FabD/lysophospholipase-like protein [Acephala macrosclerotiorum]|nr:FabD/lysophospholipase-like protein [Acephala macrosclerotiorum]
MEQATINQHGGESNPLDSTGLCLLSLDGGGVRGLSTLYILKIIMDRLNHERKTSANLPPVKPCEVFDLIGGTSTGGLIAIMLGQLEMDIDQCILAYGGLAEAVFGGKKSRLPFNIKGKVNFVCTIDHNTKDIVRLRSYTLPDESNISATIYQAALATSAATTFFEPVSIGNRTFADGGLGANNPADEVEGEAANIWCSESGDLKPLVKCFLSIGTGNPGIKAFEDSIFKFLGQTVVGIATETEETEKKFIARWRKHFDENRYFRFNVDQGLQAIGLDEYKKKGAIESATERYLVHQAQKNRVRNCIQNLRLKQNKTNTSFAALVNEFKILSIRQQTVVREAHWIVPFERNPCFTCRDFELARLEKMLFAEDRTTKIAITGLGGVGKTNLLIELVHRTRGKHQNCSIIWLPATNMESLQQAYLNIAQQLGVSGWEEDKADVKRLVQEHLNKESTGQWLLVFDNADDIDMWIERPRLERESGRLIEYLPKSKQGSIIFTTRDRKTAIRLAQQNVVEVPEMDEHIATQLLQKRLVNPDLVNSLDDTKALLVQLTYLPLAIVQAAAYINENGIALADYLSLLAEQEEEVIDLLSAEFEDDGRYHNIKNPVATTWLISFERIRYRDPLAAEFLSFIACVDPKDVPQSLLPPGPSRKKEIDAIGTLNAYSFISRRSSDLAFDIHRLVHLATRSWLRKKELLAQWTERAITRLEEVFPDDDHRNRSAWRSYLTHARYALKSNLNNKYREIRIDLVQKVGMCLYSDGRWKEAEELDVQVMETRKTLLGQEHPDTLTSIANLAATYRKQGRWKEAEELEVQVIKTRKTLLGQEHLDTLTSIANLAVTYWEQGRWKEAEELEVQVMERRKTLLGQEHPDTLTSMNNLAFTWKGYGRHAEALKLMEECVPLQTRILGANHPYTLDSRTALLEWQTEKLEIGALADKYPSM